MGERIGDGVGDEVRYDGRTLHVIVTLNVETRDRRTIARIAAPLHDAVAGPLRRMAVMLACLSLGAGVALRAMVNTDEPIDVVRSRVEEALGKIPEGRIVTVHEMTLHGAVEFWREMRQVDRDMVPPS
jgi:hypothetical protein